MQQIGAWIAKALEVRNDDAALDKIRGEVAEWRTNSRFMRGGVTRQRWQSREHPNKSTF